MVSFNVLIATVTPENPTNSLCKSVEAIVLDPVDKQQKPAVYSKFVRNDWKSQSFRKKSPFIPEIQDIRKSHRKSKTS